MSEPNGGFSFGSRDASPSRSQSDGDIDAIEVSGEPVSRNEAKSLGVSVSMDPLREAKSTTAILNKDELPADITPEQTSKLEAAWDHLRQNEVEQALTLAQEVVFEYPTLVAAKLIIARCFINRKEFDKGLAILSAIPDGQKTPETYYYIGLCQSRLGKVKEGIDSLKLCRSLATDNATRKRANDLLLHLQGEQTVCPVCGKKTLYDSMVEVDNQNVCANCAKSMTDSDDEGDDFEDDEEMSGTKRRKKLRPPLTKQDILIRLVFFIFLLVLLAFGVYLLYVLAPGYYAYLQGWIPWLPKPPYIEQPAPPPNGHDDLQDGPTLLPSLMFTSPPLTRAVVGMELRHKASIEGMEHREGVYNVFFYPEPSGEYQMDTKTGLLAWTPSSEDAGKIFELRFAAVFGKSRSRDQINEVSVSPGPVFDRLWSSPDYKPGNTAHLLAGSLGGNGNVDLLVATGEYWSGNIAILRREGKEFKLLGEKQIPTRPAAIGIVNAGEEKWVAVADYWNSRIRYYGLRDNNLSEMSMSIDLNGRPVLAGFNGEDSNLAIICRTSGVSNLILYNQSSQRDTRKLGEWELPLEPIWLHVFVLKNENPATPVSVVVMGRDFANSTLVFTERQPTPRAEKNLPAGLLVNATLDPDGRTIHCLYEENGKLMLTSLKPGVPREDASVASAGRAPALCGFAAASLSAKKCMDLVLLSGAQIGLSLGDPEGSLSDAAFWPLPEPARLFGDTAVVPIPEGEGSQVIFMGANGDVWSVALPK